MGVGWGKGVDVGWDVSWVAHEIRGDAGLAVGLDLACDCMDADIGLGV